MVTLMTEFQNNNTKNEQHKKCFLRIISSLTTSGKLQCAGGMLNQSLIFTLCSYTTRTIHSGSLSRRDFPQTSAQPQKNNYITPKHHRRNENEARGKKYTHRQSEQTKRIFISYSAKLPHKTKKFTIKQFLSLQNTVRVLISTSL